MIRDVYLPVPAIDNVLDWKHGRVENLPDVLSVFDTLKETLFLWRQNFWYLAVISLIFLVPDILLARLHHGVRALDSSWALPLPFVVSSAQLLLDVASVAALLGLLKKAPLEPAWTAAWRSVHTNTWTLFRLVLLIGISAIPFVVVVKLLDHILRSTKVEMFVDPVFYLVFLLCCLAFPLVAEERLGPVAAFKRGLVMTKRHVLFVVGCCLIPSFGEWFMSWLMALPLDMGDDTIHWARRVLDEMFSGLIGSAWVILFWSMLMRIKAVEAPSSPKAASTSASPESPSVLDS